jgi:hypothetical protein
MRTEHTIVDRVADFFERFLLLRRHELYRLLALWTLATHLPDKFDVFGYLFFFSPEPQCGKTRALEILDTLVGLSSDILISPTQAVLFRMGEGVTQLMDEVDTWNNRDDLRGVLNAGYKKGGTVQRNEQGPYGGWALKKYPVYGPRALAGIGIDILGPTTRDRTFPIELLRQKKSERRQRFRRPERAQGQALHEKIAEWADAYRVPVEFNYSKGHFPYLECFQDRTIEIAESLAAVLEEVYRGHVNLDFARYELVGAISATRKEEQPVAGDHRILRMLCTLAETDDPLIGTATELAEKCNNSEDAPSAMGVSATLQRYGFQTKSTRKGGPPRYRYVMTHEQLAELTSRFTGSNDDDPA